jgi:hypothetical protein
LTKIGGELVRQAQQKQARQMKEYSRKSKTEWKTEPKIGGKPLREWEFK